MVVYPTGLEAEVAKSAVAWLPLVNPLLWLALRETEGRGSLPVTPLDGRKLCFIMLLEVGYMN